MSSLPFTRVEINRFRGIRGLALEGLGRINLLVGANNSGKTSALEALSLCMAPLDPWMWIETARRREPVRVAHRSYADRLRWLFPQRSDLGPDEQFTGEVALATEGWLVQSVEARYQELQGVRASTPDETGEAAAAQDGNLTQRGAQIDIALKQFGPGPTEHSFARSFQLWERERFVEPRRAEARLPMAFVTPYDHWIRPAAYGFSEAKFARSEGPIVDLVRQLDDRIIDVEVLAGRDPSGLFGAVDAVLYLRDRSLGLLPVDAFGDGFRRALLMALSIPQAAGGALFIDEIETAIHVSALAKVFGWLVNASHQYNVQLFVTTHSLEAIDAILAADPTPEEDIVAYRLERKGEETKARRFGEDLLKRLRLDRGLEVR